MDLSQHRQHVAQGLTHLEASLGRLVEALAHGTSPIEVEPSTAMYSPVRRICDAYSAIDYRMDDEVGTSVVCLGVVGVNAEIRRRAEAVNDAKAAFKAICSPLQGIRTRIPVKGETSPTKAIPVIRLILRNIQRSDLNLLAAYRKIPILEVPPASVTYTRAHTRAVYRKSIDDVYEMLSHMEGPSASADRARLTTLDRREKHLALVKQRYQNIRANVLNTRLDARGRGRIQLSAELPLLYSMGRRTELPIVRFPADDAEITNRPSRLRKSKIESAPFLHSIPVYRYTQ